jgi:hypothetical protein
VPHAFLHDTQVPARFQQFGAVPVPYLVHGRGDPKRMQEQVHPAFNGLFFHRPAVR